MISSATSSSLGNIAARFVGWRYIPDFVTRKLLSAYHTLLRRQGHTPPQQGSLSWQRHYRYAYAIVVLGYVGYNFVEASRATPINLYEVLGVRPHVDEKELRNAFRVFAKRYHPDRVGQSFEAQFIAIRDAYESLKNPTTRFAYDRFGPDALKWSDCTTEREFVKKGLGQASGFYIFWALFLLVMSVVVRWSTINFWRYVLLSALSASELSLRLGQQTIGGALSLVFPNRVPFQHVIFLHELFIFLSVAITNVVPVLFAEPPAIRAEDPRTYAPFLERITALGKVADKEVSRILHTELHAMHGNASVATFGDVNSCTPTPVVLEAFTREMENMLIEHQLRIEGPIRAQWNDAVRRHRASWKPAQDIDRRPPTAAEHYSEDNRESRPEDPSSGNESTSFRQHRWRTTNVLANETLDHNANFWPC